MCHEAGHETLTERHSLEELPVELALPAQVLRTGIGELAGLLCCSEPLRVTKGPGQVLQAGKLHIQTRKAQKKTFRSGRQCAQEAQGAAGRGAFNQDYQLGLRQLCPSNKRQAA